MNGAMFGLLYLSGGGIILLALCVVLLVGAGLVGLVVWSLWCTVKQRNSAPFVPPVAPRTSAPPPAR